VRLSVSCSVFNFVLAAPTAWADSSVEVTPTEKSPIVEKAERSSDPLAADLSTKAVQSSMEICLLWLR